MSGSSSANRRRHGNRDVTLVIVESDCSFSLIMFDDISSMHKLDALINGVPDLLQKHLFDFATFLMSKPPRIFRGGSGAEAGAGVEASEEVSEERTFVEDTDPAKKGAEEDNNCLDDVVKLRAVV